MTHATKARLLAVDGEDESVPVVADDGGGGLHRRGRKGARLFRFSRNKPLWKQSALRPVRSRAVR